MITAPAARCTFLQYGTRRLSALCRALGLDGVFQAGALDVFSRMTAPWGSSIIGQRPQWPSEITDDHSPFEFSLAVEHHEPELRVLVEAQPSEPTVEAQWEAGRALSTKMERDLGASLGRLDAIEDIFAVEDPDALFGMWHAACLRPGARPLFKVYLNPNAKGKARAGETVAAAMHRLGFPLGLSALPPISDGREEISYFSLDLLPGAEARVKVYLGLHHATSTDLEDAVSFAGNYVPGEVTALCRAMSGTDGPYSSLPIQLCYSFTSSGGSRPVAATVYFPVRGHAETDHEARERILAYMEPEDRPLYTRVLRAFAKRDLDSGPGMQTYASWRRQNGHRRVTIYLSPELYRVASPRRGRAGDPESGIVRTVTAEEWARRSASSG